MTDTGSVTQVVCPPDLRIEPEPPRPSSPPPRERTGWQVRDSLLVGDRGWIMPFGIIHDDHGRLWCSGGMNVDADNDDGQLGHDNRTVHIERTEHGVRVLEYAWEHADGRPHKIRLGHVFPGDCWVVEFPDRHQLSPRA